MERLKLEHLIFDSGTVFEIEQLFCSWLLGQGSDPKFVVTPNPEMFIASKEDEVFSDFLRSADFRSVDGFGIQCAFAALNNKRVHRNTGVELLDLLARLCRREGKRLLLLGSATDDIVVQATDYFRRLYSGLDVVGICPGVVGERFGEVVFGDDILNSIKASNADVIAVGLGMRKQEFAMKSLAKVLPKTRIFIGVGGAIDMAAGHFTRAPKNVRRFGIEWLWRLLIQPSRWRRIFRASIVFPGLIIWYTLKRGIFIRSTFNFLRFIFSSYAR